jgi:hypothetical protein
MSTWRGVHTLQSSRCDARNKNVQAFEELVRKILDTPNLLESAAADSPHAQGKVDVSKKATSGGASACAC